MPDTGAALGVDLYDLYTMATRNLPDVAQQYMAALAQVDATDEGLAAAFNRPGQFGGAHGSALVPWLEFRETIRKILRDTTVNLEETAQVLLLAVDAYSDTDAAAAAEFQRQKADGGTP